MQGKGLGQDDFGGYRFQLAYMTYAMALAHVHRWPAAPGLFKPLFEKAIAKMLHPEVWIYWKDASRGGAVFNAHLSSTISRAVRSGGQGQHHVQRLRAVDDVAVQLPVR